MIEIPRLVFKIGDAEFEYIGTPEEIDRFVKLQSLQSGAKSISKVAPSSEVISTLKEVKKKELELKLPNNKEVKEYILNIPDFRHDTFNLMKHFFGRIFESRGKTSRMYHRFSRQIWQVREEIEKERAGKFEGEVGEGGLKQHVFKPSKGDLTDRFG